MASVQPDLKALAIRHAPFEDLGLLGPMLLETGWSVAYPNRLDPF
jgi:hypothetical protein